ncbi:exosortase K [Methylomonas methanica]|uniref:Exosortase K n=1 Tax=Methylomonas methanica (strain DSM 25384 / MC09) TaxID=857087 RepID=F9ZXR3_METMM|nr:exosortase K [Methylomonas methanica]AEG02218.1 hypothetical protein Metme_3864 [Methylomonas methanica MC09]
MLAANSQVRNEMFRRGLLATALVMALKQFYSVATAAQLQWQLYPLVLALELCSDLHFQATNDYEWRDALHGVDLVKSCAGINFLLISLLGYLWLWRDKPSGLRLTLRALLCAWFTALGANTLRIFLSIGWQANLAGHAGLSDDESHRCIGIAVYFVCLWLQLTGFRLHKVRRMAVAAMAIYLSIALLLPLLRACLLGLALPTNQHMLWVVGFPAFLVALSHSRPLWRTLLTRPLNTLNSSFPQRRESIASTAARPGKQSASERRPSSPWKP